MRKLKQIAVMKSTIFAVAEDGTFWRCSFEEDGWQWLKLDGPPEGDFKPDPSIEEIGEALKKRTQRMILGRGLKNDNETT